MALPRGGETVLFKQIMMQLIDAFMRNEVLMS